MNVHRMHIARLTRVDKEERERSPFGHIRIDKNQ